jgi:uncharacterized membrane protein YkoI
MLKRLNYLTHRWIGIVLGILVFVWFGSGIVLMYYPYPELTESRQLALLRAFEPPDDLIGAARAVEAYRNDLHQGQGAWPSAANRDVVTLRLERWDDHLVYRLFGDAPRRPEPLALVDARTGRVLTPLSPETGARVARSVVGPAAPLERVELLPRSDHYFMGNEQRWAFPVYRVRFGDGDATAVYVARNSGALPAVVTRTTRVTTWLGSVPHWLYFMWLYYDHPGAWMWVNLVLPGIAVGLALTGIVLGVYQLFPRWWRGERRMSGYHGMSLWHHVAGVVFGLLILTWALSGLLEVLGVGNDPRAGQAARVRGGPVQWAAIRTSEAQALRTVRRESPGRSSPVAIELVQVDGRPGYKLLLVDGRTYWVDAETGVPRGELPEDEVARVAGRVVGPRAHVTKIERVTSYDAYYYARHGREKHLPAWRVTFDDPDRSVLYLDTVSGAPVGFVDAETRSWRWWRDGLHDLDLPALINHRPWWDVVVLPLMIGGTISAITGVWLLVRRLRRIIVA